MWLPSLSEVEPFDLPDGFALRRYRSLPTTHSAHLPAVFTQPPPAQGRLRRGQEGLHADLARRGAAAVERPGADAGGRLVRQRVRDRRGAPRRPDVLRRRARRPAGRHHHRVVRRRPQGDARRGSLRRDAVRVCRPRAVQAADDRGAAAAPGAGPHRLHAEHLHRPIPQPTHSTLALRSGWKHADTLRAKQGRVEAINLYVKFGFLPNSRSAVEYRAWRQLQPRLREVFVAPYSYHGRMMSEAHLGPRL